MLRGIWLCLLFSSTAFCVDFCDDATNVNDWANIQAKCGAKDTFKTQEDWDWGTASSSFVVADFVKNKKEITAKSIKVVNTKLEYIKMPELLNLKADLTITDNKRLFLIEVDTHKLSPPSGFLILKNNERLSKNSHNVLNKLYIQKRNGNVFKNAKTEITPFQHCHFTELKPLKDGMLKYCQKVTVDGALVIENRNDFLGTNAHFTKIGGCVTIKNTQLTGVGFLKGVAAGTSVCTRGHEITGNPYLCLFRDDEQNIKTTFPGITIKDNEDCRHYCKPKEVTNGTQKGCKIIIGNLEVAKIDSTKDTSHLKSIEEIDGRLLISKTTFVNITFLSNLKRVYSNADETPVVISENSALRHVDFSSLTTVASSADLLLEVKDNVKFVLTQNEYQQWLTIAHKQQMRINAKVRMDSQKDEGLQALAMCLVSFFLLVFLGCGSFVLLGVRTVEKDMIGEKMEERSNEVTGKELSVTGSRATEDGLSRPEGTTETPAAQT